MLISRLMKITEGMKMMMSLELKEPNLTPQQLALLPWQDPRCQLAWQLLGRCR